MNTKITPKDFFLHLGATVALYVGIVALINLAFSVINYYLPDQLAGYFYANNIAWPISMLVILVPLLYVLEFVIIRDIRKTPEKGGLWIRKWRIFLTLFLTGATIVGDLIALINVYLNGEISSRFIYKILAVLVITGVVFVYYLLTKTGTDQVEGSSRYTKSRKVFAWIGIVLVVAAVVSGFLAVGSPTKQRNIRLDNQRISDLNSIQWQVINHWQQKGTLPNSLNELNDSISGYNVPIDPKTKATYDYKVVTQVTNVKPSGGSSSGNSSNGLSANSAIRPSFELCANFALVTPDNKGRGDFYGSNSYPTMALDSSYYGGYYGDSNENWKHTEGRVCFTRTIDPDKYPLNPKILK